MAAKLTNVPAATGGGKQEYHGALKGYVAKEDGRGGYRTIGSALETTDGGQKIDLVRGSRQKRRGGK